MVIDTRLVPFSYDPRPFMRHHLRSFLLCALVALVVSGLPPAPGRGVVAAEEDALTNRVRSEFEVFTAWLSANRAKGFIGEVGWPGGGRWNALAERWYADADAAELWVTAWATGEWWGTEYKLATYEDSDGTAGVDRANPQASIVENHWSGEEVLRGLNVAGGEFAAPSSLSSAGFSNKSPGAYGVAYHFDTRATFRFLAARGVELVRIPFRWERLQPRIGGPLKSAEVARLKRVVGRAHGAGLEVVLDMHNYGAYYKHQNTRGVRKPIGSRAIPISAFAEVWGRFAENLKETPGLVGYGLMNEPVGLRSRGALAPPEVWERASQRALERIRSRGDRHLVLVAGYNWSGVQQWTTQHPEAWITDPTGRVRYEAHHYWDRDNSGDYPDSYDAEVNDARRRGY